MEGRLHIPSPATLVPQAASCTPCYCKPFAQWAFLLGLLSVGVGSVQPLAQSPFVCLKSSGLC